MIDPIWRPVAAMAGLTAIVWIKLYADRLGEMRARGIDAQALATASDAAARLDRRAAADNFRNLFEVPVLFYVLCIALVLTGGSTQAFVTGAWAYVGLRVIHTLIHVTYNRVVHRFLAYVASTLLLFALWAAFLPRIL